MLKEETKRALERGSTLDIMRILLNKLLSNQISREQYEECLRYRREYKERKLPKEEQLIRYAINLFGVEE